MVSKPPSLLAIGLIGALTSLAAVGALGACSGDGPLRGSVAITCYFDDSVHGLDVGSPVKARGVPVGSVTKLGFAPDGRHVEVVASVVRSHAEAIGFVREDRAWRAPESLRAMLLEDAPGGGLFVQLEFVDPGRHPPPVLAFETAPGTVPTGPAVIGPSDPSTSSRRSTDLPARYDELAAALRMAIEDADVAGTSSSLRGVAARLDDSLSALDPPELSRRLHTTLDQVGAAAEAVTLLMEDRTESGGGGGLFAAVGSIGLVADTLVGAIEEARIGETSGVARGLLGDVKVFARETHLLMNTIHNDLVEVRRTLESTSALLTMIERDPGVFLRGRGPEEAPALEQAR